jgi:dihydroneopterin aldolase
MNSQGSVQPILQSGHPNIRHVFVRDLVIPALIGIHKHEKDGQQNIRINLDMEVPETENSIKDRLSDVVCYEEIVDDIRGIVNAGHINLVETLAEKIAARILTDKRIERVRVKIEKLDIFADASSVGIEIERSHHQ